MTLSGTNTYSGGTIFNDGVLAVSSDSNLGTGSLKFAGGTLEVLAGGGITSSKAIVLRAEGAGSHLGRCRHDIDLKWSDQQRDRSRRVDQEWRRRSDPQREQHLLRRDDRERWNASGWFHHWVQYKLCLHGDLCAGPQWILQQRGLFGG